MNKNITYNLDEAKLRGQLERYEIGFDEQHWLDAEKNLDALGLQRKANVTLNTKKIGIFSVLVLLAGGLVAFINYNKNKNTTTAFADVKTENNAVVADLNETTGIKVTNELPKLILNRKSTEVAITILATDSVKPKDIIVAENIESEKKIAEVVKEEKKQENNLVVIVDISKKDIVMVDNHETKKKKKKRRKKHHDGDGVTPNTHSAGEDDVIISE